MHIKDIPNIDKLSAAENLQLMEELWESVRPEAETTAVPESHKRELDRRRSRLESGESELLTLDEIKERVAKKRRK